MEMDLDEKPRKMTELANGRGLVNGHKDPAEYTAEDMFSGPAVESPEPTKEPTPPAPMLEPDTASTSVPPAPPSLFAQAPILTSTSPLPLAQTSAPPQTRSPPVLGEPVNTTDVEMPDVASFTAPPKAVRAPPTPSNEPPAKRLKTEPSSSVSDMSKRLPANQQKFLFALLRQVKKSKDATPFREPVDPVKLNIPRYFEVVSRPMDISTIEKKLNGGEYPVAQVLVDDFNLMIENCVKFNGPENPVTKMGKNIQATFEKGFKSLPPEQVFLSTATSAKRKAPPAPKPVPPPVVATPTPFVPPKPIKAPSSAPARRPSGAFPPIRRESLTADGRPKREIKPPPERDIPMDKPRLRKKHAMELRFCGQVLKELQKKVHEPYSYPFLAPVDAVALQIPDYYKIVKQPMDLGTVEQKLKEQQYATADEFYADVKLVFKNCYKYNGMDSPVAKLAQQLERVFDKKWLEKPEEPPEKPSSGKRGLSSSPPQEEESSSDEDEIGRIQEQMTLMAKKLSEMQSRKKQRHEKSPKLQGKGSKGSAKKGQRSTSGTVSKPKKPKEVIPDVTFEQKRELSEKINFLSPSKMQGVLELIKDAMPLDSVMPSTFPILIVRHKKKLSWISIFFHPRHYTRFTCMS
jgi:bromodomain-containing factor 1